jgi:hypothetical protein
MTRCCTQTCDQPWLRSTEKLGGIYQHLINYSPRTDELAPRNDKFREAPERAPKAWTRLRPAEIALYRLSPPAALPQNPAGRALDDQYFTQQLLPDFMNEHPDATAAWDVVFDARGHFHEPHTGRIVPLGTIEVRRHLLEVAAHALPALHAALPEIAIFPTCGPEHRYGAILFVEKEGFLPLFRAVRLAERYDLAIMSTKGLSVTASRLLVDQLCATPEVPLLVLHDFDKSGFSILGTLRRDTRRYAFRNRIQVVDLGLRLEDVEESNLETEEVVHRSDPAKNLRENGATTEEIAFLRSRRVELNAFASADFVAWIERKLAQHGVTKIVPDRDTLMRAWRRSIASGYVASRLQSAIQEAQRHAAEALVPDESRDARGGRAPGRPDAVVGRRGPADRNAARGSGPRVAGCNTTTRIAASSCWMKRPRSCCSAGSSTGRQPSTSSRWPGAGARPSGRQ